MATLHTILRVRESNFKLFCLKVRVLTARSIGQVYDLFKGFKETRIFCLVVIIS